MCYRCVERREDLSDYTEKRLPLKSFHLFERSVDFHDTGKLLACSVCVATTFCGNWVYEANSSSGGKWIVQCCTCGRLHVLPFKEWDPAPVADSVQIVGQS